MQLSRIIGPEARPKVRPFWRWVALAAALRAGAALLLLPFLTALFTDPALGLAWLCALLAAVATGWMVERRVGILAFDIGLSTMTSVNDRLIGALLAALPGWLTAHRQAEARRALSGTGMELFAGFVNFAAQIGINLLVPGLLAAGLLFACWPLGLVALLLWPMLLGTMGLGARMMRRAKADFAAAGREVGERSEEFARNQALLRAAGRGGLGGPVTRAVGRQRRATMRLLRFSVPGTLLFSLMSQLAVVSLFGTITALLWSGRIGAVEAVALGMVVMRYLEPVEALAAVFPVIETLHGTVGRTVSILDAPRLTLGRDLAPSGSDIALDDVRVALNGQPILNGVNLRAAAGQTTAIVGPSGAGKSTILSLIARFHDPDEGAVRVGGTDLRDLSPDAHLSRLSIVFQTVQLLEGSIAENIRIARPDATDAEVAAAASAAGVDEIADRIGGMGAAVGQDGQRLSGGERQRISIARAFLKQSPIVLLDEATSALDTASEAAIARALATFRDRTIVIVAHRIETVAQADRVFFVDEGRVVEDGTPAELIARGGRFAAWWAQSRAARAWHISPREG